MVWSFISYLLPVFPPLELKLSESGDPTYFVCGFIQTMGLKSYSIDGCLISEWVYTQFKMMFTKIIQQSGEMTKINC